ncbi:MAG: hypothetical protein GY716_13890 [bacterium]|nr:hypothetical protein [bacterium]
MPVNTDKAWLIYSYRTALGTTSDIGQKVVRGRVTGPTSLQFDRDRTGQAIDLAWQLVEFQDLTTVQHANAAFSSAELQKDVSINAVDSARAVAVGGYATRGGKSPFGTNDHTGVCWFTSALTSGTNLRLQRDFTGSSTADLGWFVIQFSPELSMVKRAFQSDGTPVASGSTLSTGMPVKFLLYINNPGGAVSDVSMRDILDPLFSYVGDSVAYDNSVASCAAASCTVAEEAAILAAADSGTVGTDAVDGDVVSLTGATVDIGNQIAANAQLDIAGSKVWAVVFTIRMQ